MSDAQLRARLSEDQRARLRGGHHESVADELAAAGEHELAGWVLEQIWAFARAAEHYLEAGLELAALEAALEERGRPDLLETVLVRVESIDLPERQALLSRAARLLEGRGRHLEAARLLEAASSSPQRAAAARIRAGDRLGAARSLAANGDPRAALDVLGDLDEHDPQGHALAARLWWDLGDAEQAARHAQSTLRAGGRADAPDHDNDEVRALLARALASLGHELAAQIVLARAGEHAHALAAGLEAHGRYRITAISPATLAGAAYVGIDRVTLQEVEVHLLLAEYGEHEGPAPEVLTALERFSAAALTAASLGHPAIRPIARIDASAGLLVLPRAVGPVLRSMIRPPGMRGAVLRARSVVAFLLDGLAAAHARGLVHGAISPSQIVSDALDRPQLGPFGAHLLSGLHATRTGGLEEVLSMTAPEVGRGEPPSPAADVFACGALFRALLAGHMRPRADLPDAERALVDQLCAPDPEQRPTARRAVTLMRSPVADVTRLEGELERAEESIRGRIVRDTGLGEPLVVVASSTWSDALLDALSAARNPWFQTVLDREGRTFHLAPWPTNCRRLPANVSPADLIPSDELAFGCDPDSGLEDALRTRLVPDSVIMCPSGERLIALDQMLRR